ncbi:hypothetical protein LSAT2_004911 [Lamellibrachia satsuma]|nr:hypothetical protein LSAT2_004911 [Lamellibrachia satsuma]
MLFKKRTCEQAAGDRRDMVRPPVRQRAGDARVTPGMSRQRRLTRPENVTLRGDTGVWSVQYYSVKNLVQVHSTHFPIIVKVARGFHNNTTAELPVNQVLQIHDCGKQRRVEALDSLGRNLSIPADYPVHVTPTDGERAGDYLTLAEATVSLPVKVEVLRTMPGGDGVTKHVRTGQMLLLRSVGEIVFLRANAINRGWIDQSRVLTIPSFLGTEFATAEGMRGATNDEWTDYKNMFSRSVRHVNFDLVQGPPEIFILCEPRSVSDIGALPFEQFINHRTLQETTEEREEGVDQQLKETMTHVYARVPGSSMHRHDCTTDYMLSLHRDVGSSCSRA